MRLRVPVLLALAAAASVAGCASQYGYDSYGQNPYNPYYGRSDYYGHGDYDNHYDQGYYNRDRDRGDDGWR